MPNMTKPRSLPNVTVVAIDCVAHDLTRLALERTLEQIEPAACVVISDQPSRFLDGTKNLFVLWQYNSLKTIKEVDDILWYSIASNTEASHILNLQYDGWVLDGSLWQDSWLEYDYIGAPWPWHRDGLNVGNGGFSLRSTDLMRYLTVNPDRFPRRFPEDETLCRVYRPALEAEGFRWAPLAVAQAFSFEREKPRPTFGFHGIFNLPHVLNPDELTNWKRLAPNYVRSKVEWKELP